MNITNSYNLLRTNFLIGFGRPNLCKLDCRLQGLISAYFSPICLGCNWKRYDLSVVAKLLCRPPQFLIRLLNGLPPWLACLRRACKCRKESLQFLFLLQKEEFVKGLYTNNPQSMLQYEYKCALLVAYKPGPTHSSSWCLSDITSVVTLTCNRWWSRLIFANTYFHRGKCFCLLLCR